MNFICNIVKFHNCHHTNPGSLNFIKLRNIIMEDCHCGYIFVKLDYLGSPPLPQARTPTSKISKRVKSLHFEL